MSSAGKKIGVLLSTAPDTAEFQQALEVMTRAVESGARVFAYGLDDGVCAIADARLQALRARGLVLYGCAYAARRRGLEIDDRAVFAGLGALGDLLAGTDEFRDGAVGGGSNRSVLILTEADPHLSGRVAEAVRVTAGLAGNPQLGVRLALCGPAAAALRGDTAEMIDGDVIDQYLPGLAREAGRVLTGESAAEIPQESERVIRL